MAWMKSLVQWPCGGWLAIRIAGWLIAKQKYDKVDALLEVAIAAHPQNCGLAVLKAYTAQVRNQHPEAIDFWYHALRLGAEKPLALSRIAASQRALGEHLNAQTLIDDALIRHPNDIKLTTEAARLAQDRNRPHVAAELWRRAIVRAKPHADWLQGYGESLILAGNLRLADRVLASAKRQYPDIVGLIAAEGKLALARGDWPRAAALWTDYRRRSPDDKTSWDSIGLASYFAQLNETAQEQTRPLKNADNSLPEHEPIRRLLLAFESIGDNCELGLVQRRFGAEPLGLLRWNDVPLDNLIAALEQGFEGMGEPKNTTIATAANGEIFITDNRWDLAMHTFLHIDRVDPNEVYKKMCRRIVYLRNKLLEDIIAGKKIFVYRSSNVDLSGLRRLHRALRARGPATLLGVQPVLSPETKFVGSPVGNVERVEETLYLGFLSRPFVLDAQDNWDIDFDTWKSVFTNFQKSKKKRWDSSSLETPCVATSNIGQGSVKVIPETQLD